MRYFPIVPPRTFEAGFAEHRVELSDCAHLELAPDEQVTFLTERGAEYDVCRKAWGYYATPSLNGRLASFGLRAVLVRNREDRFFVLLVETGKDEELAEYARIEQLKVVCWLDSTEALKHIERLLDGEG